MDKTDKQRGGAAAAGEGAVPVDSPERKKEDFRWAVSLFSGLKQLCTSLLLIFKTPSLYGPLAGLAFRCVLLFQAVDFFQCQLVKYHFLSGDHNYFFPILLLFRYLIPRHFDEMFAATTKALACDTRPDLVNRRAPPASKQLVQYLSSMIFAYFILGAVSMTLRGYEMALTLNGFWTWSRFGLILVITYHYLQHKKVGQSLRWAIVGTMTCTAVAAPGSLVTAVEFAVQQRLFYHALLQPYLVRVQFKAWQERAWFQQYELELQGFALSAWILCSCHVVGALMVPPVFSAMVCMLSNSCGRMENLGDEQERDIMEKRTPGVKAVALGQSRAVEGHWDAVSVNTFIGNANQPSSSSTSQNLGESGMSSYQHVDQEEMGAVSENQIQKDRQITLERKQNLLNEYRRQHQQFQQQQQQQQSPLPLPQHHHYYHPQAQLNPSFVNPSSPWLTSAPRLVSSIPEASAPPMSPTLAAAAAAAESTGPQSKHGNRKPSETTPPAPPAPSAIPPLRPNHIPGRPDLAQDHPENTRPAGSNPDDATGARPRNFNSFNSAGWMAPPRTGGGGGGGGGDPYNSAAFVSEAFQWPGELGRRFMDQGRRMAEEGRRIAEESQRRANDGRRAMERVFEHAPDALKKGIERMVPGNPQYHPHHGDKQEVEDYEGEETRAAEMDGDLHEKEVVRRRGRRQHREDGSEKLSRRESERANHQASESARPGLHLGRMVSDSIIDTMSALPSIYPASPTSPSSRRAGSSASMTGSSPGAVRPRRKAPWQRGGLSEIIAENMQNLDKVITEELEGIGSRMWKRNPHVVRPPSTPPPLPSSHE